MYGISLPTYTSAPAEVCANAGGNVVATDRAKAPASGRAQTRLRPSCPRLDPVESPTGSFS